MFEPKKYLEGKIDKTNCHHELLAVNFDSYEGMYGDDYTCLICGREFHNNIYRREVDLKDKFLYKESILEKENIKLIKFMLNYVAKRYENEDSIDIATIFKKIYPEIEKIANTLNKSTETDKKLVLDKFK